MSGIGPDNVLVAHGKQFSNYLFLAGLVILFYDHLLTLNTEIAHIWVRSPTRGSAWFLLVRYFALCSNIATSFQSFLYPSTQTCHKLHAARGFLIVGQQLLVGCTLFLRVCAMYASSKRVRYSVLAAGLITVTIGAWSVVPAGPSPILHTTLPGCHEVQSRAQSIRMAAAWETELAYNILVLGLTLHRGYKQTRVVLSSSVSLWQVMVRDGVMYFGMICLANLANIFLFYFGNIMTSGSVSWFTSAISVTMVSRLMLNLREAASPTTELPTSQRGLVQEDRAMEE